MQPSKMSSARLTAGILLLLSGLITTALAGPPLLCHPLDIGKARSLPWTDLWNLGGNTDYNTKNLVKDTLGILDSGAPVIVRMETLRRATLYARKDPQVARELLTRLYKRAADSDAAEHPDAPAWFDVGYTVEAYRQLFPKDQNPAAGLDGYSFVTKAIGLRGRSDPQMELGAALITLRGPEKEHQEHARKAIAGAKDDPLLARNLASRFLGNEKETVSDALLRTIAQGGNGK